MTFAKSRMRWVALATLAVLAISAFIVGCGPADRSMATMDPEQVAATPEGVSPQSGDAPEQSNLPPLPPKEPPQYPNLDSNLNRLAEVASSTLTPAGTDAARSNQDDEPVLVTFYIEASRVDEVREYLEENGIFVRNVGEDYIEAHVPPSQLGAASERPGVLHVNTVVPILPPQPTSANALNPAAISQGVGIHGADAWHGAGFRGENVKVGVIDSGFEGFARLQGTELPRNVVARCYFMTARAPSSLLSDCEVNGSHGTTVAETLLDVAPNVTLYIANPVTKGDFRSASDWMTGQGVTVINLSGGWAPLNPGDGTSPFSNAPLKTVDRAVAGGAVFITAGGNAGRRVWYGTFADPDGDRWHNFNDQVEANHFTVTESKKVSAFVRWDGNWGREDCDIDLALFRDDTSTSTLIAVAGDHQDGGANRFPFEYVEVSVPTGVYSLSLWNDRCATMPAWIQLFLWNTEGGSEELLFHSSGRHMAEPAEGRNLGMMAVGATHWWDTQQVAGYSSRGPTIDGRRVKPDITGITCNSTVTNPPVTSPDGSTLYPTCGTSHASPHVAGLAALVKQRFTNYRPNSIAHYLKQNTAERGSAGADNTWGYGLAELPDPPQQGGSLVTATLTRPSNVLAVSQAAGELTLMWEGGDNADSYVLIAVHMGTFDYETTSIGDGAAKTGTVTGLIGGEDYLGIVVALQVLGDGSLETLYGSAAPVPVQSGGPATDRAVLVGLYNATGGANWTDSTNWLSSAPLSEWHGVTTDDDGRVTELLLRGNNLVGSIPPRLGDLFNLERLDLQANSLIGNIPSDLGHLTSLERLDLDENRLTGQIPSRLANLVSLTFLDLDNNQLNGPLPSWLGTLTRLEHLLLEDNQFSGMIPSELGNLVNLERIRLAGNSFTGCVPAGLRNVATNDLASLNLPDCAVALSTGQLEALFDVIIDKTERREAFSEIKEENLGFSAFEDMKGLRSEFVASKTQTELYHALVKLSNARRDRHLRVSPVVGGLQPPEQRPCASAPIRVLPDISDVSSPMFFVARVGQGLTSPEIGDVVVAVNDLSMAEYVDAFTPWIRHSSLPGLYWRMAYDLPKRVSHVPQSLYSERLTLTLERSSGQRYNVSLLYSDDCADFFPYSSLPGFVEVMSRENFNVLLDRNRQIIFLQWRDFEYSLIQDIVDLTEYAEREQILDYDMIIDVTLSGGGSRGAYAIQRLVDWPFRVTFGNVRLSDAGKRLVEIFAAREPNANAPDVFGLNLSG